MKRTLIKNFDYSLFLEPIASLARGAMVYDSSCSPEARVYFIDRDSGYYLKRARAGALAREAEMDGYFHSLGLGAEVVDYRTSEFDYLLTRRVEGEDCTHEKQLADPKRLAELLGTELRKLHELRYTGCPVQHRTTEYLATAEENYRTGNYDKSQVPDSFGYRNAEEAYAVLKDGKEALCEDTLIHGDFCLPNIILKNGAFSGYIDLGASGVGDRHIDLFWGAWTLWFNLGTDEHRDRFFYAYGRDKVDKEILKIVAACEVFG